MEGYKCDTCGRAFDGDRGLNTHRARAHPETFTPKQSGIEAKRDGQRRYKEKHRADLRQKQREYLAQNRQQISDRKRRAYYADPEAHRERTRRYAREHPETAIAYRARNKERIKERARLYKEKHREDRREKRQALPQQKKDEHARYQREWKKRHPEQYRKRVERYRRERVALLRFHERLRRARKLGAPGHCPEKKLVQRLAIYGHRCYLCGAPADTIDHVKPLSKGGSEWPSNLRPACLPCNLKKKDKWPYPSPVDASCGAFARPRPPLPARRAAGGRGAYN